jgi:[histone H3]-lysine36 N-trimethyltransferase
MTTWPLLQRNKVDDSKITVPVTVCTQSEDETVKDLAQKVCFYFISSFVDFQFLIHRNTAT